MMESSLKYHYNIIWASSLNKVQNVKRDIHNIYRGSIVIIIQYLFIVCDIY